MSSNNQITPNINKSERSDKTFKVIMKPDEKKKPVIKKKDPSIGNTGSVQSSLVSTYNHLTNSKKIIGDAKDYETSALKIAIVVTRKIFPLILIIFQLFLYLQSLTIISSYQDLLNFNSQQFNVYYKILTVSNYLSLAEFFLENNDIYSGLNSTLPLPNSLYRNLTLSFTTNENEKFDLYQNLRDTITHKYDNFIVSKIDYDSFQWNHKNDIFETTELNQYINVTMNYTDTHYLERMYLFSGVVNFITLTNKFIDTKNVKVLKDILYNLYKNLIPNINLILKSSLQDIINLIKKDQSTFTLVFIISITCIFTSGSLNYYTYVQIKALAERIFILFKDIPVKSVKNYLESLEQFQAQADGGKIIKKEEEKKEEKKDDKKKFHSYKNKKFYVKKLNLIPFFFIKLVFLMFSLSAFFFLNYFIMLQYMEDQQTFLSVSNFLFVVIYNNTAIKLQANELLKEKYDKLVFNRSDFEYTYDMLKAKEEFFILGGNKKNADLNAFYNDFLINNICNSISPNTSHYCDNPAKYNNQYNFGLISLIDNYNQYFQSLLINSKVTKNSKDLLFFSEDYRQLSFYYYNFIEDQMHLPVDKIKATYKESGDSAGSSCHLIFGFFIVSLFAILSYFTSYFLTKMKNVLNDCKDFMVNLPNNFFKDSSALRKFLMEMANEIKMHSNV
jgi:hypothetical protein